MSLLKFKQRVAWIPAHLPQGDPNHPDAEFGYVSSATVQYVFVRFDKDIAARGNWADTNSKACSPNNLVVLEE